MQSNVQTDKQGPSNKCMPCADPDTHHQVISRGRSPEGRLARRTRRREASAAKREKMLEERAERKQMVSNMGLDPVLHARVYLVTLARRGWSTAGQLKPGRQIVCSM
jgi:hypothetical protein